MYANEISDKICIQTFTDRSSSVFVIGAAGVLILSPYLFKAKQFPVPYLLPVSFYSGQMNDFGMDKIQAVNDLLSDAVVIDSFCENIFQANMLF